MSRSLWRCRNPGCPVPHGAVLGRVKCDVGLVLDSAVRSFAVYLDTWRAMVSCPRCKAMREFWGKMLIVIPTNIP